MSTTRPRLLALLPIFLLSPLASPLARADFDALPYIKSGQIITGAHDDDAGTNLSAIRVFDYAFGEFAPAAPYHLGDPGFNNQGADVATYIASQAGTTFTPNSYLYASAVAQPGNHYLTYWNGQGAPAFSTAPTGITLALTGAASMIFGDTSLSASTLAIGRFNANGTIHEHLATDLLLNGSAATSGIPNGFYLITLQLSNPASPTATPLASSLTAPTDTLYYLFATGFDDTTPEYAAALAEANTLATTVPEPTAALATLPALALLKRRR